jgi:hypothetical protein
VTQNRTLTRLARGLTSGALALTVLGWGGGALPASAPRPALADDLDCYNDASVHDTPECVQKRSDDAANGTQPADTSEQQQTSDAPAQPPAQQPTPEPTQAPAASSTTPASSTNPKDVVLRLDDAGKEAFVVDTSDGSDKWGRWAHSRFERDRSDSASTLGPNVMDSKAWVAKDLDTAKALFKEQAAIKSFPERKEPTTGPVEKVKPTQFGEDSSYTAMYYQDDDNKIWQHYRFVMRQGTTVAVVYLFGKEVFFVDPKEKNTWNLQGDWFTKKVFERM